MHPPHFNFEGPEKKLHITFRPAHSPLSSPAQSERGDSDDDIELLGLRSLSRDHIDAILRAASCTVISLHSNSHVDAYLLSESSLFVADTHLTIKTCGTTTLLPALSVIISMAYDLLAFTVAEVQFSRVAYLFPQAQPFPHDSFENEVAYLNAELATAGHVFETRLDSSGSKWHLYFANCLPTLLPSTSLDPPASQQYTLEINMFQLDPSVMSHFVFDSCPDSTGSQFAISHTTPSAGISALLDKDATLDAFNFQPCGYSMNALLDDAYYTIHITPESDASYVSFETTAEKHLFPQLISAVVKLFQPGHFVASLIAKSATHISSRLQWPIVSKLLCGEYVIDDDEMFSIPSASCHVCVALFRSCDNSVIEAMVAQPDNNISHIETSAREVGLQYGAEIVQESYCTNTTCPDEALLEESENPTFLVDLSVIARNVRKIRTQFSSQCPKLRFSVRCNSDEAILCMLNKLDIHFEVSNISDVKLLHRLGISPSRILFASSALIPSVSDGLNNVGTVSILEPPNESVLAALKQSKIDIEIRVQQGAIAKLNAIVKSIASVSDRITCIAFDKSPDKQLSSFHIDDCNRFGYFKLVQILCDKLCDDAEKKICVNLGDVWERYSGNAKKVLSLKEELENFLPVSFDMNNVSVDVSKLIVGNSVSLITHVIGRRIRYKSESEEGRDVYGYYLDDGIYGAFSFLQMGTNGDGELQAPSIIRAKGKPGDDDNVEGMSILFGPTCDASDRIWEGKLPVLNIGDRLVFRNMGANAASSTSSFNGFGGNFDSRYMMSASCCSE